MQSAMGIARPGIGKATVVARGRSLRSTGIGGAETTCLCRTPRRTTSHFKGMLIPVGLWSISWMSAFMVQGKT